VLALALEAMATRFELVLDGGDAARLRAAGEEALAEIERAEGQLSRYRATSDVAWINAAAGREPVRVDGRVFALLRECAALSRLTHGAFDVTVGPLMAAYGFTGGGRGTPPDPARLREARALVGMDAVELDPRGLTVRLPRAGMQIDLGAVGKGYALDRAVAVLEEHGVPSALLHGGTSSVHVVGTPPGRASWPVAWSVPGRGTRTLRLRPGRPALSVSAPHGKGFLQGGRLQGHVLDPRTGQPTSEAVSACVAGTSSTLCDALSTAVLVGGEDVRRRLHAQFPGYVGWAAWSDTSRRLIS
jgi:thiamine biosynthesis lipoprotein